MGNINYSETVAFMGRNGFFKAKGLEITEGNKHIQFSPITSKGQIGNCAIQIPKENIPQLIHELIRATNGNIIAHIWSVEDVEQQAREDEENYHDGKIVFDRTRFAELLEEIDNNCDSNFGITWQTISDRLDDYEIDDPFDYFLEYYKPVKNHIDTNSPFDGCMFETYETELEHVKATNPKNVWTIVETDGALTINNGLHIVNRIGYFITTRQWEYENMEFAVESDVKRCAVCGAILDHESECYTDENTGEPLCNAHSMFNEKTGNYFKVED